MEEICDHCQIETMESLCDTYKLPVNPILCHTYTLDKRLNLNRIAPTIDEHLIKEQTGFRLGKSCTSQLLYTNEQPIHNGTRSFIYIDDPCITAHYQSLMLVEELIEEALDNLTTYHNMNNLRDNPEKHIS